MATKKKKMIMTTSSVQATAMAIAGRASRACDVCGIQRARWYCAADEAYLCAKCDTTVHGANALALRHDRVRLEPHGVLLQKSSSLKRSSSSSAVVVVSKHSKNGSAAAASASRPAAAAIVVLTTEAEKQLLEAQTRTAPTSAVLDSKPVQRCRARDHQVFPSRKRSRTSRPRPHHLRSLTTCARGGGPPPRYNKIQKSSIKDEGMVQVKIETVSDFMVRDLDLMIDDDEEAARKKSFNGGGAHEVPAFITVMQEDHGHEFDEISPGGGGFAPGFRDGRSASSDSFSPFFKGKAAAQAAHAEDELSDDADQFLVPDCLDNCCGLDDSGVEICCDVDGTISLVVEEDSSVVKEEGDQEEEEEKISAVEEEDEFKLFSSKDLLLTSKDSGGGSTEFESTDFASTDFGSPDFGGPRDIMCDEFGLNFDFPLPPGSSESFESETEDRVFSQAHAAAAIEQYQQHQQEPPSPFAKFLPGLVKLEGLYSGKERVKKEAQEILRCSLEALSEEDLRQLPSLRLNYEDVLNAWSDRGAFWMDPQRARLLNSDDSNAAAVSLLLPPSSVLPTSCCCCKDVDELREVGNLKEFSGCVYVYMCRRAWRY